MNIKQRDFEVSGWLEKYAEPLGALNYLHHGPTARRLRHAWRSRELAARLICGCSVDQTHEMFPATTAPSSSPAGGQGIHLAHRGRTGTAPGVCGVRPVANVAAVLRDVPGGRRGPLVSPDGSSVDLSLVSSRRDARHQTGLTPWQAMRHLDFLREQLDNHNIEAMDWNSTVAT
jgi:hypothetical protein